MVYFPKFWLGYQALQLRGPGGAAIVPEAAIVLWLDGNRGRLRRFRSVRGLSNYRSSRDAFSLHR
jgi:hypothetical protein